MPEECWFMGLWLVLILSGLFGYWAVGRHVDRSNQQAFWLLWLILMTPPLFTVGSVIATKRTPALGWIILVWLVSAVLYGRLIRPRPIASEQKTEATAIDDPNALSPAPVATTEPPRPINEAEEDLLRQCFPWSTYFLEKIEYRAQAVVCRGKLRLDADQAYQTIKSNIAEHFGDRFFVIFQSGLNDQPFFALVPNTLGTIAQRRPVLLNYLLAVGSLVLAIITTCQMGAKLSGTTMAELRAHGELALQGWPYALTILSILGAKDISRYLLARWHRIITGLLYFIPLPFFPGTCGTFLQLQAPIPHRRALFDLGFASAALSLSIAIPTFWWGLQHSTVLSLSDKSGILDFASFNPRFSLLLTGISKLAMGKDFGADTAINLHPVAIAAYLGLLITAVNLLPFRRFDGGYIIHAMFGLRGSIIIGQISKVLLLILGFIQYQITGQNGCLLFAFLLTFFPIIGDPTLNDVAELDSRRDLCGMLMLAITVAIFLPAGGAIANLLHV
jgi:membrane-associated protease RseP (regulator of RpoE activity)